MTPPRLLTAGIVGCLFLAVALVVGCGGTSPDEVADSAVHPFLAIADGVEYVGDAACATCHEDLYASYQSHGMANSFYAWSPDVQVERVLTRPIRDVNAGYEYVVLDVDGRLVQEERLRDPSGAVVHTLRRPMDFVMGSGSAARTYFFEENDRLYQLPLTWYTQADDGAGRWDFSPGYEVTNGRFDRLIPDRCTACHNGHPETVPFVEGKYPDMPMGIGCESCHGPGATHVAARLEDPEPSGGDPDWVDPTIVNTGHLDLERRLDTCQQCHLHATTAVLREDEDAFSYVPGRLVAAHRSFFALPEEMSGDQIPVVSHADRMRQSACFTVSLEQATFNTAAPMECTTCHNPHEGFREAGPGYFNQTCQSCHAATPDQQRALQALMPTPELQAQHADGANCFSCHMPKVEADDAPHSSFTDHLIRVVDDGRPDDGRPVASEPLALGEAGVLAPYYERDAGTESGAVYEGMATSIFGTQIGDPQTMAEGAALLTNALRAVGDGAERGEAQFLLGVVAHQLGKLEFALPAFEAAVDAEATPQRLEALARARTDAVLAESTGASNEIDALYVQALDLQPALATVRTSRAAFLHSQGRRTEALDEARAARAERPSWHAAALVEGLVLLEQGNDDDARSAFRDAVRLDPANAALLADLVVRAPNGSLRSGWADATVFGLPLARSIAPRGGRLGIAGTTPGSTLSVFTTGGVPLRTVRGDGLGVPTWDLRSERGAAVPPGSYLVHVRTPGQPVRVVRVTLAAEA
ncbi:MAG: tetratricopeptide repeat protein [Bacteroidota bacterium]